MSCGTSSDIFLWSIGNQVGRSILDMWNLGDTIGHVLIEGEFHNVKLLKIVSQNPDVWNGEVLGEVGAKLNPTRKIQSLRCSHVGIIVRVSENPLGKWEGIPFKKFLREV